MRSLFDRFQPSGHLIDRLLRHRQGKRLASALGRSDLDLQRIGIGWRPVSRRMRGNRICRRRQRIGGTDLWLREDGTRGYREELRRWGCPLGVQCRTVRTSAARTATTAAIALVARSVAQTTSNARIAALVATGGELLDFGGGASAAANAPFHTRIAVAARSCAARRCTFPSLVEVTGARCHPRHAITFQRPVTSDQQAVAPVTSGGDAGQQNCRDKPRGSVDGQAFFHGRYPPLVSEQFHGLARLILPQRSRTKIEIGTSHPSN